MATCQLHGALPWDQTSKAYLATEEHDRPVVRALALCDITVDETVQARAKMMAEVVVDEYAEAMQQGDAFPPIDVFQEGEPTSLPTASLATPPPSARGLPRSLPGACR